MCVYFKILEHFQNIKSSYEWVERLKVILFFLHTFPYYFFFYFVNVILISSLQIHILKGYQDCRADTKWEQRVNFTLTSQAYCLHLIDFYFLSSPSPWLPSCTLLRCSLWPKWWVVIKRTRLLPMIVTGPFKAQRGLCVLEQYDKISSGH